MSARLEMYFAQSVRAVVMLTGILAVLKVFRLNPAELSWWTVLAPVAFLAAWSIVGLVGILGWAWWTTRPRRQGDDAS